MDEKYILYDVLNTEKNIVVNMATSLNEASCEDIYNLYYKMFNDISIISKNLFNIGYNNEWYTLEQQNKTKISNSYDKLNKTYKNDC